MSDLQSNCCPDWLGCYLEELSVAFDPQRLTRRGLAELASLVCIWNLQAADADAEQEADEDSGDEEPGPPAGYLDCSGRWRGREVLSFEE